MRQSLVLAWWATRKTPSLDLFNSLRVLKPPPILCVACGVRSAGLPDAQAANT